MKKWRRRRRNNRNDEESDNLSLDNDEFKEKRNIDISSITLNIENTSKNLNK